MTKTVVSDQKDDLSLKFCHYRCDVFFQGMLLQAFPIVCPQWLPCFLSWTRSFEESCWVDGWRVQPHSLCGWDPLSVTSVGRSVWAACELSGTVQQLSPHLASWELTEPCSWRQIHHYVKNVHFRSWIIHFQTRKPFFPEQDFWEM